MSKDMGASPGSRERGQEFVPALTGFDPARIREVFPFGGFAPGDYMGRCHSCGATMDGVAKRSQSCFDCAAVNFKAYHVAVERALRIRLWNAAKERGASDRVAMMEITETLGALATEARRAETENTGSVHEGAGLNEATPNLGKDRP